jgi:hypothetical protein
MSGGCPPGTPSTPATAAARTGCPPGGNTVVSTFTPRATSMNPKHFHTPASTRARCPVCHEAVYSRAGIHPQCAVKQSEPPKVKAQPPGVPKDVVELDAIPKVDEPPVAALPAK